MTNRRAHPSPLTRGPPSLYSFSVDGIPMRKLPAPLARLFQQICASMMAEALAGSGIVQLELGALGLISDVPGIEQWRLAEALGIDRTNAGLICDRLEKKGLVQRRVNDTDRRARQLHPTASGAAALNELRPKVSAANTGILAPLSRREQSLLIDLLVKLIEGNRHHLRPGAGRRKRGSVQPKPERRTNDEDATMAVRGVAVADAGARRRGGREEI